MSTLKIGILGSANIARQFVRDTNSSLQINIECTGTGIPRPHRNLEARVQHRQRSLQALQIPYFEYQI